MTLANITYLYFHNSVKLLLRIKNSDNNYNNLVLLKKINLRYYK